MVEAAQLVEAGILPRAGGWREQAALFCDSARFVLQRREMHRKELEDRGKSNA